MPTHIENEAARCLRCKSPACQQHCPISTPIPSIVQLFRERKLMEAGETLFQNNPMSVICAIVCDHGAQCAGHCVLGWKGTPVQFYEIKKYVSDAYLDRISAKPPAPNGKRIAVIGSGPAGLTVAILLAQKGYSVTIFEKKHFIGGMLRYGIPEFRLPKSVLSRYERLLKALGVYIRTTTTIGGALRIDDLKRDGYAAIFVGTGAWRPRTLGVQGECLGNVHFGVSYLENAGNIELGRNVAIIGIGNVAMDVARTAFRHGAERVTLYSRDNRSSASPHELSYAQLDGADLVFGKQIVAITPEGPLFRSALTDGDGNITGYSEETELIPADSVVIAISQRPKDKLLLSTDHLEGNAKGLMIVDENQMSTVDGVFAAGDVVTGPQTVVHAVQAAKHAADAMDRYVQAQSG